MTQPIGPSSSAAGVPSDNATSALAFAGELRHPNQVHLSKAVNSTMAELHWKEYPYPAECVYLVMGGKTSNHQVKLGDLVSMVIVGRSPEAVENYWLEAIDRRPGWEPLTCMSMAQMSPIYLALENATKSPESFSKIPASGFFKFGKSAREPWYVLLANPHDEKLETSIIMAHDVNDIDAWAKSKNKSVATVLSHSVMHATIAQMDEVRTGKSDAENYASEGQDWLDANKEIDNWSPEEQDELTETLRREKLARGIA